MRVTLGIIALALLVTGCSGKRFEYRHPGEIPDGPGMFTGEDGVARIGGGSPEQGEAQDANEAADCACPDGRELQAYREFLRWKAEAVGTPEYREFQQWREWRRQRSGND